MSAEKLTFIFKPFLSVTFSNSNSVLFWVTTGTEVYDGRHN